MVQCSPNFSEGRRSDVLEAIAEVIAASGVKLISVAPDAEHNRTVISYIGTPEAAIQAAVRGCEAAVRMIDLTVHRGDYPRMGAVDAIPIMPLAGCDVAFCVKLAQALGQAIAEATGIPVFLYEEAATQPDRTTLDWLRVHQFEGLQSLVGKDPTYQPDYGPARMHPTAGCTVVAARLPQVTLKVYLATGRGELIKFVHAIEPLEGFLALPVYDDVQGAAVVLQIRDYRRSPLPTVCRRIQQAADQTGVTILRSELVGWVPLEAVVAAVRDSLKLSDFGSDQILEMLLLE